MDAVVVHNLSKVYGKEKIQAVDSVSFSVSQGELFGLIGPDGAGKTSIFRMLTTLLLPDSGTASVDGFDVVKDYKKNPEPGGLHAWQIFAVPGFNN